MFLGGVSGGVFRRSVLGERVGGEGVRLGGCFLGRCLERIFFWGERRGGRGVRRRVVFFGRRRRCYSEEECVFFGGRRGVFL